MEGTDRRAWDGDTGQWQPNVGLHPSNVGLLPSNVGLHPSNVGLHPLSHSGSNDFWVGSNNSKGDDIALNGLDKLYMPIAGELSLQGGSVVNRTYPGGLDNTGKYYPPSSKKRSLEHRDYDGDVGYNQNRGSMKVKVEESVRGNSAAKAKKRKITAAEKKANKGGVGDGDDGEKTKNRTRVACENCHRSKTACDAGRPCSRCVRLNKAGDCVDRPHRRHGRPWKLSRKEREDRQSMKLEERSQRKQAQESSKLSITDASTSHTYNTSQKNSNHTVSSSSDISSCNSPYDNNNDDNNNGSDTILTDDDAATVKDVMSSYSPNLPSKSITNYNHSEDDAEFSNTTATVRSILKTLRRVNWAECSDHVLKNLSPSLARILCSVLKFQSVDSVEEDQGKNEMLKALQRRIEMDPANLQEESSNNSNSNCNSNSNSNILKYDSVASTVAQYAENNFNSTQSNPNHLTEPSSTISTNQNPNASNDLPSSSSSSFTYPPPNNDFLISPNQQQQLHRNPVLNQYPPPKPEDDLYSVDSQHSSTSQEENMQTLVPSNPAKAEEWASSAQQQGDPNEVEVNFPVIRLFLQESPGAGILFDIACNTETLRVLGYNPDELANLAFSNQSNAISSSDSKKDGDTFLFQDLFHPDYHDNLRTLQKECIYGDKTQLSAPVKVFHKDGTEAEYVHHVRFEKNDNFSGMISKAVFCFVPTDTV